MWHTKRLIRIFISLALTLSVLAGCATLPENIQRSSTYSYANTNQTRIGQAYTREKQAHPGKSGATLLWNGLDAFVVRGQLIQMAQKSIDAQYYLLHYDRTGKLFLYQLLKAANRGVRVRLLVDDMDFEDKEDIIASLESHPNIAVRIFNPFSRNTLRTLQYVIRFGRVTRRMHNKTFIVDNQVTVLGGRNIGNEYFEADPELEYWDLDVMAIGPIVKEISASFDLYWNHKLSYPAKSLRENSLSPEEVQKWRQKLHSFAASQSESRYMQAMRNSELAQKIKNNQLQYQWCEAVLVQDSPKKIMHDPGKLELHLFPKLKSYLKTAQEELIIISPYFVPGDDGVSFLSKLSRKGVNVRILTNSLASTDVSIVHAGYSKYRKDLLRAGIELYEMNKRLNPPKKKEKKTIYGSSKPSLHAKAFVMDRERAFIGSLNYDPRAVYHNTEIGLILKSPKIAQEIGHWFEENIEHIAFRLELSTNKHGEQEIVWKGIVKGQPREFKVDPYSSFWRLMGIGLLSILPIDYFL